MTKNLLKRLTIAFTLVLVAIVAVVMTGCDNKQKEQADVTAPVFAGATEGKLADITLKLKDTADLLDGIKATDETDGEVTVTLNKKNLDLTKVGSYEIEYTAVDKAGNIAIVKRTVNVVDTVAPFFVNVDASNVMSTLEVLQYSENVELVDDVAKVARDNYDQDGLQIIVSDMGGLDFNVAGEYTITYKATDKSNNAGTATRKIVVKEAVKWVEDIIEINGMQCAVSYNMEGIFEKDVNQGAKMRTMDQLQLLTKDFYTSSVQQNAETWANNGGVPYLPYCVLVVLDKDMKPVLVRNATYALECVLTDGVWTAHKNGVKTVNDQEVTDKISFIDGSAPAATGVGITGSNLESYIPDGGFVLIASASKGGALDTGKILVLKNLMSKDFGGGALAWGPVETDAAELCAKAQFEFKQNVVTLYEKPAAMEIANAKIEKHILSWDACTGAKEYQIYIDGELKSTVATTSVKMVELTDGMEVSGEGQSYKITIKAISKDIRYYGDSALTQEIPYVKVQAQQLAAPVATIAEGEITWGVIEHAEKYEIYAKQLGESIKLGETNETNYDLSKDTKLAQLIFTANIYVKAIGDGAEYLDSELSTANTYMCSVEKVIRFADGGRFPIVETNCADYFARRNDATAVGYASKNYLYLITDAVNADFENNNLAASFVVVLDKDNKVKSIINIVNTTQQLINGEWVTAASINYTSNSKQLAPLAGTIVEGDKILVGKNGCTIVDSIFGTNIAARDVLSFYFWASKNGTTQVWRTEHVITEYPTFEIKLANDNQLDAPVLSYDGSNVSWIAVANATSYEVKINNEVVAVNGTSFNLKDYVAEIGKSGANALNYTDVEVQITAKAEGKLDGTVTKNVRLAAAITDGTTTIALNYNLANTLWNGGSGANFRANDKVAVAFTGAKYKEAVETYKGGYSNNNSEVFMNNGLIVILDKDMKVKQIRFGFACAIEVQADGSTKTEGLTWNNGGNSATGGGNLVGLPTAVEDTDYILIFQNAGSKAVLKPAFGMFIDTNVDGVVGKTVKPGTSSETAVDITNANYAFSFVVSEVVE